MSKKRGRLFKFLSEHNLSQFYDNFVQNDVVFTDLRHLEEDDLEDLIPRKIPRKRLARVLKIKSGNKKEKTEDSAEMEEKEENDKKLIAEILVKWKSQKRSLVDVPLGISDELLIAKIVFLFHRFRIMLPGRKMLSASEKRKTLQKWFYLNRKDPDDVLKAVLKLEDDDGQEIEKMKESMKEKEIIEKKMKELEKENEKLRHSTKEIDSLSLELMASVKEKQLLMERNAEINAKYEVSLDNYNKAMENNKKLNEEITSLKKQIEKDDDMGLALFGGDTSSDDVLDMGLNGLFGGYDEAKPIQPKSTVKKKEGKELKPVEEDDESDDEDMGLGLFGGDSDDSD